MQTFTRTGICPVCYNIYETVSVTITNREDLQEIRIGYYYFHGISRFCKTDCDIYVPVPAADVDANATGQVDAGCDAHSNEIGDGAVDAGGNAHSDASGDDNSCEISDDCKNQ